MESLERRFLTTVLNGFSLGCAKVFSVIKAIRQAAEALQRGTTLCNRKYVIWEVLGRGAFGITYKAVRLYGKYSYNVAIKELFSHPLCTRTEDGVTVGYIDAEVAEEYKADFLREAETMRRLYHHNIAEVYDVFVENNTIYYVMEFIDGYTVEEYINDNGRLSAEKTTAITEQVCFALQYMHDNHIMHLDINPANILLTQSGEVKLIDFGSSRQYDEKGNPEDNQPLGRGAKGYAPEDQATPEHYNGKMPIPLEVYALGATMFVMLTGERPPDPDTVTPQGIREALEKVETPKHIIKIVTKAMAHNPDERYQTMEEMHNAIERRHPNKVIALTLAAIAITAILTII